MSKFITNINLQDGNELEYDRLEEELGKESFRSENKNPLKAKAHVTGKGIFSREGSITIHEVTAAVLRATHRTGKKYSFFVLKEKYVSSSNQ